jgi:hypothetical protein
MRASSYPEMKQRKPYSYVGLEDDQKAHDKESVELFNDHLQGGPKDSESYDARRAATKDRLKRYHTAKQQADALEK